MFRVWCFALVRMQVYVQHKMEEHSKDLFRLLFLSNTHIFVCG